MNVKFTQIAVGQSDYKGENQPVCFALGEDGKVYRLMGASWYLQGEGYNQSNSPTPSKRREPPAKSRVVEGGPVIDDDDIPW